MHRRVFLNSILATIGLGLLAPKTEAKSVRKPKLLLECKIAGFQYYDGERLWHSLAKGQKLKLLREPDNRYDRNAVAVYHNESQLGYLPRKANYTIAQMMDRGENLEAEINRLREGENWWERVGIEILTRDAS